MVSNNVWAVLSKTFRKKFVFSIKANQNWFPGHMHLGMKQIQNVLTKIDCVIEVHDARIPISGRNRSFKHNITGSLPHILVLNKADLIEEEMQTDISKAVQSKDDVSHVLFTNCKDSNCSGIKSIVPLAADLIQNSERYNRSENPESRILVIGVPNVGKSSLINILRQSSLQIKGTATAVGNRPGVTRAVLTKIRVSNDPLIYLVDTPGIMIPNIKDMHMGMKLALCATLLDQNVGVKTMADYLLFYLNRHAMFDYVDFLGLDEPSDDINVVLAKTCINFCMTRKAMDLTTRTHKIFPAILMAADYFVNGFRNGKLGKITMDEDIIYGLQKARTRTLKLV